MRIVEIRYFAFSSAVMAFAVLRQKSAAEALFAIIYDNFSPRLPDGLVSCRRVPGSLASRRPIALPEAARDSSLRNRFRFIVSNLLTTSAFSRTYPLAQPSLNCAFLL